MSLGACLGQFSKGWSQVQALSNFQRYTVGCKSWADFKRRKPGASPGLFLKGWGWMQIRGIFRKEMTLGASPGQFPKGRSQVQILGYFWRDEAGQSSKEWGWAQLLSNLRRDEAGHNFWEIFEGMRLSTISGQSSKGSGRVHVLGNF